jgi:hypothetical protein
MNEEIDVVVDEYKQALKGAIDAKGVLDGVIALKAKNVELENTLRYIYKHVTNGRLCYFGDHTGYESKFSSGQTEQWAKLLGAESAL